MRSSYGMAGQVIMCLNVELALVTIQKCLSLLHDDLDSNTKKLLLINQSIRDSTLWLVVGDVIGSNLCPNGVITKDVTICTKYLYVPKLVTMLFTLDVWLKGRFPVISTIWDKVVLYQQFKIKRTIIKSY